MVENQEMNKRKFFIILLTFFIAFTTTAFVSKKAYSLYEAEGLYIVKINPNLTQIQPYVSEKLEIVYDIAKKTNASVAINTGFFDAKNKKTVSFIKTNDNRIFNPQDNENLISNPNLEPHLDKIYNRGEFRLYNCNNKIVADITYHHEPQKPDCTLLNSTQAGPVILPQMDLEKEFFVTIENGKVIRDGAGLTRKTHRSLVAIKDNFIYFIITDQNAPLTIYELQQKLSKFKFEKALGFDGGGSVSLFVKDNGKEFYQCREKEGASRPIKSALIVY